MTPTDSSGRRPDSSSYLAYSAIIDRPPVRWPNGARLAVWLAPNIEHYEFMPPSNPHADPWPRMPHPDVWEYSRCDFGNRVGFWRMTEVLDQYDVPVTVSLNTAVLDLFPDVRHAMVDRNWELMSHGIFNTRYLFGMSVDEERQFYRETADAIMRHSGQQLRGMLGPAFTVTANTPRLMAEAGLWYQTDWFVDDQPFPLDVGGPPFVGVPYSRELNDVFLMMRSPHEGDQFVRMCKEQFDVLYAEGETSGRVMCIALHPHVIGQPHRIGYLDEVLAYITGHEGVWMATASEIARHYIDHHHREHVDALDRPSLGPRCDDGGVDP